MVDLYLRLEFVLNKVENADLINFIELIKESFPVKEVYLCEKLFNKGSGFKLIDESFLNERGYYQSDSPPDFEVILDRSKDNFALNYPLIFYVTKDKITMAINYISEGSFVRELISFLRRDISHRKDRVVSKYYDDFEKYYLPLFIKSFQKLSLKFIKAEIIDELQFSETCYLFGGSFFKESRNINNFKEDKCLNLGLFIFDNDARMFKEYKI